MKTKVLISPSDIKKLYEMYKVNGILISKLATDFGCGSTILRNAFKKNGLKIRSRSESKRGKLHPLWGKFGKDNPLFQRFVSKEEALRLVKHFEGCKMTEERKKKISLALKGKAVSISTREKLRKSRLNKPWSEKQKEAQSKVIRKGKPIHTEETRRAISLANKGEKSCQWKGGVTPINEQIRKSLDYKFWREAVFKRDDFTCQFCDIRGGILQADHIKPFCNFPDLRFNINNGRTLCKECHKKTETYGIKATKILV